MTSLTILGSWVLRLFLFTGKATDGAKTKLPNWFEQPLPFACSFPSLLRPSSIFTVSEWRKLEVPSLTSVAIKAAELLSFLSLVFKTDYFFNVEFNMRTFHSLAPFEHATQQSPVVTTLCATCHDLLRSRKRVPFGPLTPSLTPQPTLHVWQPPIWSACLWLRAHRCRDRPYTRGNTHDSASCKVSGISLCDLAAESFSRITVQNRTWLWACGPIWPLKLRSVPFPGTKCS